MTMRSWLTVVAVGVAVVGAAGIVSSAASASVEVQQRSAVTKVTTPDWAGYAAVADKGTRFRYVAADFDFPNVTCYYPYTPNIWAIASDWIGLDGYGHNHGPAEQIGVSVDCGTDSQPYVQYWAWYRGASGGGTFLLCTGGDCPGSPSPGDRIDLSVYFTGKKYRFIYDDVTMKVVKKFYLGCAKCRNANASAEVINQARSGSGYNWSYSVGFFGVRVTSTSGLHGTVAPQPRHWTTTQIFMVDPASTPPNTATPSALLRHGRAFSVSYTGT